jgi:hypothetical protein
LAITLLDKPSAVVAAISNWRIRAHFPVWRGVVCGANVSCSNLTVLTQLWAHNAG